MNNIYGLVDSRRSDWVMYVGKGLEKRARSHWKSFLGNGRAVNIFLRRWFEQLRADGVVPDFIFLEENVANWQQAERDWIAAWRRINSQLCNVSKGGNVPSTNEENCRLGGLIGGSKGGTATHLRHPDLACDISKKNWREDRERMLLVASSGGKKAAELGRSGLKKAWKQQPEAMAEKARKNGALSDGIGQHNYWHLRRGIWNPNCKHCFEVL